MNGGSGEAVRGRKRGWGENLWIEFWKVWVGLFERNSFQNVSLAFELHGKELDSRPLVIDIDLVETV